MSRTALLAGATGLVGSRLLPRLLDDPRYAAVRVLTRRPLGVTHPRLHVIHTDYADLPALSDALGADDVYCCLGTTQKAAGSKAAFEAVDLSLVAGLAQGARRAGAKRFLVISAVGAGRQSPSFYSRVKARMEQAVSALDYEAVHILRPSLLLGERAEHRPAEALGQKLAPLLSPLLRGPLAPYRPVTADEVAQALRRLAFSDQRGVHIHTLPLA